jgi:L-ribulose-5-phosphate 3-epimerase
MITRRGFLAGSAAAACAAAIPNLWAAEGGLKVPVGSCHMSLEEAKQAGLEGVEVGAGGPADTLPIFEAATRAKYKEQMKATGLPIRSFMMSVLNSYPLATDPRGQAWLEQCVDAAKDLNAKVILVAFFGKGDLRGSDGQPKKAEVDSVVQKVKAVAARAKDAGVILGLENRLTAVQNIEILDRINSDAVGNYYDIGNLTGLGYDCPAEIRLLKDRMCQIHFKDGGNYLGEGKVKLEPIVAAMKEINYKGWIVLETSNPSKNKVADDKRNAETIRKLFAA